MKTICTILFCILVFSSCRQDLIEYSCDPVINEYISNHRAEYSLFTINDLADSEPLVQQAIFRSFTPEKKRDILLQKVQYLLDNETYTDTEYDHVGKLLNHLHENYFSKENIKLEASQRSKYATEWIFFAKNSLGWSDRYIAFVVFRMYIKQIQFDNEIVALKSVVRKNTADSEGDPCGCNTAADFCGGSICNSGNCQLSTGCGWMWSETCSGRCL